MQLSEYIRQLQSILDQKGDCRVVTGNGEDKRIIIEDGRTPEFYSGGLVVCDGEENEVVMSLIEWAGHHGYDEEDLDDLDVVEELLSMCERNVGKVVLV